MYYANIKNNEIIGIGAKLLNEGILNIEITDDIAKNIQDYKFISPDKIVPKTKAEIKAEKLKAQKQKRIAEIKAELEEIDRKTIRPLRAGETEKLKELEQEAEPLRKEIRELEATERI